MKLFAFNNGGHPGWYQAITLAEDGKIYAEHICSHECFVAHDLGADGRSDWKHDQYDKAFGAGNWSIEYVAPDAVKGHEALQAAIKVAKELPEENFSCERAGATVVIEDDDGKEHEQRVGF